MTQDKRKPTHAVYAVEGDGDKARWTKIGAAWGHHDGDGFNISLDCLPLNGRLVVRKPKPDAQRDGDGGR